MADCYVFADEAGNFDFRRQPGASKYFVLATVTAKSCNVGDRLLRLRRELGWKGMHLDRVFHATEDPQAVRDEVFAIIADADFRVDATILEKAKAQPHLRNEHALYASDVTVPKAPRCVLAGRERSVPSGRRLLHVGDSAGLGA